MTGDGANDSGALKAADIGISIASAKSITAVDPEEGCEGTWNQSKMESPTRRQIEDHAMKEKVTATSTLPPFP